MNYNESHLLEECDNSRQYSTWLMLMIFVVKNFEECLYIRRYIHTLKSLSNLKMLSKHKIVFLIEWIHSSYSAYFFTLFCFFVVQSKQTLVCGHKWCVCVYICFSFARQYWKKHNFWQVTTPGNWVSTNHIIFRGRCWPLKAKETPLFCLAFCSVPILKSLTDDQMD